MGKAIKYVNLAHREVQRVAGAERIEWRRRFPVRPITTLGWYVLAVAVLLGVVLLLFAGEPARLDTGRANPLAALPIGVSAAVAIGALPYVLAVVRRPVVAANHYALTVRPGWTRTLVLPWAKIAEVAINQVRGERYLLVRCHRSIDGRVDGIGWLDQAVLRAVTRDRARLGRRYDVAVRMRDFVGSPESQLAAIAAFAPDQVHVANHLS